MKHPTEILQNIEDIELEDIDYSDYPDFVDAYISKAYWIDTDKELTEEELDNLNSNTEFVYDQIVSQVMEGGE